MKPKSVNTSVFQIILYTWLVASGASALQNPGLRWWEKGVIYQIYPRSFQDSDVDGVGDLQGIARRADYLATLGIQAVWISPIYKSPMKDGGYDISNFTDIDPMFGNIKDFEHMAAELKKRGINVILDFVPNHTSDQHPFFVESKKSRSNRYSDWFVWKDGIACEVGQKPPTGTSLCPPNNWVSRFDGSAWHWVDSRQQFYLHTFMVEQPDLNFRNPVVVEYMKTVLKYWLDYGVDGFRLDAVIFLVENKDFRSNHYVSDDCDRRKYRCIVPDYELHQQETLYVLREWTKFLEDYQETTGREVFLCNEPSRTTKPEYLMKLEKISGAKFSFNFVLLQLSRDDFALGFAERIRDRIRAMAPFQSWPNWVIGNHDKPRIASKFGSNRQLVDVMNTLLLLLPGTPTTYYGDELGMIENRNIPEYMRDDTTPEKRDGCRTPMQWDNSMQAAMGLIYN